jgi:2-polyprenyl-6-methoxyphenol hydroxylase-like FAD-dependent oxidoreductase
LADRLRAEGGDLRENARFEAKDDSEGVVWTNGRAVQSIEQGWRWFGLKVHAQGVDLAADLEMHGFANAYVGLCRLPANEINVCGLFRGRPGTHLSSRPAKEMLRGAPGSLLHERLARAEFQEDSFCAVAGLPLRSRRATHRKECRLGDALTMIPPVTGNGMSMAFEAAEIALQPLAAYARGETPWNEAQQAIARTCDATFRSRLFWAQWLQWMMFAPTFQGGMGALALSSGWLWRLLFTRTR